MNLFGLNLTLSRSDPPADPPAAQRSYSPEALAFLRGEDLPPDRPYLISPYEQSAWVYRAINALAEQVANIPFLFSRGERGRETLITSGPLHDFYNRPHPQLNRFQYWELRILWLMLRGECIRIPIFHDDKLITHHSPYTPIPETPRSTLSAPRSPTPPKAPRRLDRILMLDPSQFQHIVRDGQFLGWHFTGRGPSAPFPPQTFLPEEVWFERLPNPYDPCRGLAPLQLAQLPAQTDFAAASFMRGLLEHNGDVGLIVRTEQQLTDQQREQLVATLHKRKRSSAAVDRSILLWGAAEILHPKISSADLQFLENRKFSRAEICAAFGVPEEIITATDHAKYDVMQGARLNFIQNRVLPLCARLEAEEAQTVKAIDPTAVGWFDFDSLPIMQEARRQRLLAAKTGFDMGIPFNELNRIFDLGFKPLPWGDKGYLPSTLSEIGSQPPS